MKYAKIIDKGECYSTLGLVVNGVPANKQEWAKYNFYPKNEMVGEVIYVNGMIVLKITEDIYVPMSSRGVVEITEKDYIEGKKNNVFTGMDERQRKINDGVDAWINLEQMLKGRIVKDYTAQLEQDAEIYYSSYRLAVSKQGESIQYRINMLAKSLANSTIVRIPLNQAINLILSYVKEEMGHEGWQLDDVDGVSWFLGLYDSSYVRALGMMALVTEREVFVKGFVQYFNELQ